MSVFFICIFVLNNLYMNIADLITHKIKGNACNPLDLDRDIIVTMGEISLLGRKYTTSIDDKIGRSLTIDGYEFKQDGDVSIDNLQFLVWAVLEDKIILKLVSREL